MLKGLIFDFDGLILDTETPEYISWQEVFQQHGCELSLDVWSGFVGAEWGSFDPYAHLAEALGHPVDKETIRPTRRLRNQTLLDAEPVRAGVLEYLQEALQGNLAVVVASSAPHDWVDAHLQRLELMNYFTAIFCCDDVERPKPSPDLYLAALDRLGITAGEAVAFEDSPNGILAAKRAGLFCVAIPNPVTVHLDLNLADMQLPSLQQMPLNDLLRLVEKAVRV